MVSHGFQSKDYSVTNYYGSVDPNPSKVWDADVLICTNSIASIPDYGIVDQVSFTFALHDIGNVIPIHWNNVYVKRLDTGMFYDHLVSDSQINLVTWSNSAYITIEPMFTDEDVGKSIPIEVGFTEWVEVT